MSDHMTSSGSMAASDAIAVPDGGAVVEPAGAAEMTASPDTTATVQAGVTAGTAAAAAVAPTAPAIPTRRGRLVALVFARRLARLVAFVALVGLGVALGWQVYQQSRPVAPVVGDPAVIGVPAPAVVAELANAIGSDDADAIRAALTPDIFSSYAADMERFGIASIESVETLGTYADGPRSATQLVILARLADRSPFTINMVVVVQDGQVVRLR